MRASTEMMHLEPGSVTQSAEHHGPWRLRRLAPVAVVVLVMAVVFAMGWHRFLSLETLVRHRAAIDGFVAAHYGLALAAFLGVYVAAVALSIPGAAILTITGGVLFGWLVGAHAAILGATAGATLVFLIARGACGESILRRAGPLAVKLAQGFRADAFNYLLFLRLVPVFPFWLVNLAPAVVGVRLGTFVLATALGIIPGTFAYALVGAGLDSVLAAQEAAYQACLAGGRHDCRLDFALSAVATPQLLAAFVALGAVALIPVAVRKWRARGCAGMPG
jgi:uncharacterized membrane protein YdjX (TVP38/TMEM64 family)